MEIPSFSPSVATRIVGLEWGFLRTRHPGFDSVVKAEPDPLGAKKMEGWIIVERPLQPYIRLAMHHTYLKGYYIERHIWDHEIIFIDGGRMKITIEDKVYFVEKNDCVILRPNVYHKIEWAGEDCEQPHVHFDFFSQNDSEDVSVSMVRRDQMTPRQLTFFREDYFTKNDITIPNVIKLKEPFIVRGILFRLIDEYTYKPPYSDFVLQGTLCELIGAILRDYHLGKNLSGSPYAKDLTGLAVYMSDHVEANLSLEDLAMEVRLSKWNLIRWFKKYYDATPMQYFSRLRFNYAKKKLQYSFCSVKEVAYQMNFDSPQAFSRWFKALDGNPPAYYHKKNFNE
jgi:AraC-like DNA-binding protein/quercetin dioxygenase-like cupin family protein